MITNLGVDKITNKEEELEAQDYCRRYPRAHMTDPERDRSRRKKGIGLLNVERNVLLNKAKGKKKLKESIR